MHFVLFYKRLWGKCKLPRSLIIGCVKEQSPKSLTFKVKVNLTRNNLNADVVIIPWPINYVINFLHNGNLKLKVVYYCTTTK